MKNIDEMTDEEIDAYLAETEEGAESSPGGRDVRYGIFLLIAGMLATVAAVELILSELILARDPGAALICDINPLIGCSTFLTSWQGHLLGISNAILGAVFFAGLAGIGLVAATGSRLTRTMWLLLLAAAGVSLVWLAFFFYESFAVSRTLCPWCFVIWLCLIPFVLATAGRAHRHGALPLGSLGAFLDRRPVVATLIAYGLLAAFIAVWFRSEWALVFSL